MCGGNSFVGVCEREGMPWSFSVQVDHGFGW